MQAILRQLHSPDVYDLKAYTPEDPDRFGFLLEASIGPADADGEELFSVMVCTPDWLKQHHGKTEIISGRHYLIVFEYEFSRLEGHIASLVGQCVGETWRDIAQQLSRWAEWEFEDYKP